MGHFSIENRYISFDQMFKKEEEDIIKFLKDNNEQYKIFNKDFIKLDQILNAIYQYNFNRPKSYKIFKNHKKKALP